jgi:hypothetical protein
MKLSAYMIRHGLIDRDMAAMANRDKSTISRIRRGVQMPDWPTMLDILIETDGHVCPDDFIPEDYPDKYIRKRKR